MALGPHGDTNGRVGRPMTDTADTDSPTRRWWDDLNAKLSKWPNTERRGIHKNWPLLSSGQVGHVYSLIIIVSIGSELHNNL